MTKLTPEFFAREAVAVAQELLGRHLVCTLPSGEILRAKLREIAAYEGQTKTTSKGASYAPGCVSVSVKFGHCLMDIATGEVGKPSCVTLRRADLELGDTVEALSGPGIITARLGIVRENRHLYDGIRIDGTHLWIEGASVDRFIVARDKGNSKNCVGIYRF